MLAFIAVLSSSLEAVLGRAGLSHASWPCWPSSSETQEEMTNLLVELTLTSRDIPADLRNLRNKLLATRLCTCSQPLFTFPSVTQVRCVYIPQLHRVSSFLNHSLDWSTGDAPKFNVNVDAGLIIRYHSCFMCVYLLGHLSCSRPLGPFAILILT